MQILIEKVEKEGETRFCSSNKLSGVVHVANPDYISSSKTSYDPTKTPSLDLFGISLLLCASDTFWKPFKKNNNFIKIYFTYHLFVMCWFSELGLLLICIFFSTYSSNLLWTLWGTNILLFIPSLMKLIRVSFNILHLRALINISSDSLAVLILGQEHMGSNGRSLILLTLLGGKAGAKNIAFGVCVF